MIVRQAWSGPDQIAKRTVQQRGNAITVLRTEELERWRQKTSALDVEWQKEVSAKGFDGKKLLDSARTLIAEHAGEK